MQFSKLKKLRKDVLRMTQEEFANKINAYQHQVSDWEKGYRIPKAQNIIKINNVFESVMNNCGMDGFNKFDFGMVEEMEMV